MFIFNFLYRLLDFDFSLMFRCETCDERVKDGKGMALVMDGITVAHTRHEKMFTFVSGAFTFVSVTLIIHS